MKTKKEILIVLSLSVLFLSATSCVVSAVAKRRCRRFGVRPLNRNRNKDGFFASLIAEMKTKELDTEMYFRYTRMTPNLFQYLLEIVGPQLQKDETKRPLSPEHRLMITIHYLAEGCSMQEICWGYRIGKATAHKVIKETCKVLWDVLSTTFLPQPDEEEWSSIENEFFLRWNLPNCVGAVDGKHVTIMAPKKSGSDFFNYKKHFSLVVLATCDAYYRFTMVDIGAAGANHDSAIFKNSCFGRALLDGELGIPPPKNLPRTNSVINHYICGDSAFPLHKNIVRPYPGSNLGQVKNIFNYRLSRGRRTIENTFGIWSQRWRILRKPIIASLELCELIVQATIVLHNFLQNSEKDMPASERKYCPTGYADASDPLTGEVNLGAWRQDRFCLRPVNRLGSNNPTVEAKQQRDILASYFVSPEGYLPWQENYVLRGSVPTEY